MQNIIKKHLREAVGVPRGIHEVSSELYQSLLKSINDLDDNFMEDSENGVKEFEFSYRINLNISDFYVQKINLTLKLIETKKVNRVTLGSMSFKSTSRTENAKIIPVTKDNTLFLDITYGFPPTSNVNDLKEHFKREKTQIISSLSHELKHAYDHFKLPTNSIYDISKYSAISNTYVDIRPMRHFLFLLYYSHAIENLVRPSELYSNMRENNISQVDFYNFITTTEVWENLTELSNWDYETFRDDLKNYQNEIKQIFDEIYEDNQIKDIDLLVDEFLRLVYVNLVNRQISRVNDILVTDISEMVFGLQGDKRKLFNSIVKTASRFEKNPINFYIFEGKKFHKNSFTLKKKIGKLYTLVDQL